jgi:shikimate dehydrogenase
VLGSPVAHSLSPVLHRAAYRSLALGWVYDAVEVGDADALTEFVERCDRDGDWVGLSLTMPLKKLVQPLLDDVTETAQATGAVNTLVFETDAGTSASEGLRPRRVGHNTDVAGIVQAVAEAGVTAVDEGLVLGGGATACSAVAALGRLGAARVRVVVRSPERAQDVVTTGHRVGVPVDLVTWPDAAAAGSASALVVSTVPASAAQPVVDVLSGLAAPGVLLDVVYDPWPTPVARAWERRGGTSVGGFAMLLHQAAEQVRLMTGRTPDVEAMRNAGLAALSRRSRT